MARAFVGVDITFRQATIRTSWSGQYALHFLVCRHHSLMLGPVVWQAGIPSVDPEHDSFLPGDAVWSLLLFDDRRQPPDGEHPLGHHPQPQPAQHPF